MGNKKVNTKKSRTVKCVLLSVLLVIAVIVNIALYNFSDVITSYFTTIDIHSKQAVAARAKSKIAAGNISDEGIILLQNNDNTLPLKASPSKKTKVNVFGWSFTNPVYAGSGSGGVDTSKATSPKKGLEDAGFQVNQKLYDDYVSYSKDRPVVAMNGQDWTIQEPKPADFYTDARMKQAKDYSDTAIIFLSRSGGEGADLPTSLDGPDTFKNGAKGATGVRYGNKDDLDAKKSYLELSNREKGMVDAVTKNFNKVILVVNSSNPFELGWVKDYNQIKSVVNIAGPGEVGFGSLGKVLSGAVNPSGRTVDIYAKDLLDAPAAKNFGNYSYVVKNKDGSYAQAVDSKNVPLNYVNYSEGVYVGYRYYETAAQEGSIDYDSKIQYPFGYGLSYTKFKEDVVANSLSWDNKNVSVKVKVTNTGSVAGKDVVELYYSAPYTGKLEKSSTVLGAFTKTDSIKPGDSQTVTLSFKTEDMASYDYNKAYSPNGAYVLEGGEYKLMLMKDSHDKIADVGSKKLSQVIYDTTARSTDKQVAVNELTSFTGEGSLNNYLSRANKFANLNTITDYQTYTITDPKTKATQKVNGKLVDASFVNYINGKRYNVPADKHKTAPTTDAKNGLKLKQMFGLKYNDEKWNKLLDELSVSDMVNLVTHGGYKTPAISSVGKPATIDYDGPAAITAYISKSKTSGIAFPSEDMLASTWNVKLAQQMGECIGNEGKAYNTTGWYAPSMDTHRTAFGGRNFEYYSEDGLLAGEIASSETKGYQGTGGYAYMKHFAMNDQETNRTFGVMIWDNEQAAREIYLKPFEIEVKEGGAKAVMSAFNSIGNTWCGETPGLLQKILRGEWGFNGMVNTDFYINGKGGSFYPYMDFELGIRSGNDIYLTGVAPIGVPDANTNSKDTLWALRESSHNILYCVANSRAVNGIAFDMPTWAKITIGVDVLVVILIGAGFFFTLRKKKDNEKDITVGLN